jgi:hypothetical protein
VGRGHFDFGAEFSLDIPAICEMRSNCSIGRERESKSMRIDRHQRQNKPTSIIDDTVDSTCTYIPGSKPSSAGMPA